MTLATFSQAGSEEVGNGAETVKKVKISQDVLNYSSINPKYNITLYKKFMSLMKNWIWENNPSY